MSEDESLILVAGLVLMAWGAGRWYLPLIASRQSRRAGIAFGLLFLTPVAAMVLVHGIIWRLASADVRPSGEYLLFYDVLGAGWFFQAVFAMNFLGLSYRDDAIERCNPAAMLLMPAMLVAHAAIYAGANVGNGPGWWTVVAAGAIGAAAWTVMWLAVEATCHVSEAITVDRDVAAAIRLSGYALGMGSICARGAAGDWTSLEETIVEFAVAWPILPMTLVVIALEKLPAHSVLKQSRMLAAAIALLLLASAGAAVWNAGPVPHNPFYDTLGTVTQ